MAVDTLPPIPAEDFSRYEADNFGRRADERIATLPERATPLRDDWKQPGAFRPTAAPAPPPAATDFGPPQDFTAYASDRIRTLDQPAASTLTPPRAAGPSAVPMPSRTARDSNLVAEALNAAEAAGVDPALFVALVDQESSFNPRAQSPAGAQGLTQLMPATARGLGVRDPWDPRQALEGGARYLKQQLDAFGGDVVKALAAYNAGPGAVQRFGGIPPYEETQRYVDRILTAAAASQTSGATPTPALGSPTLSTGAPLLASGEDISQFGDPQLTTEESYAACGPAAAVRFAQRFGRNPTLREALDIARQVGWTASQGMAGLGSQKALMDRLGVPTRMVTGAQWDLFAREAATGNPVTISTPGHYFYADAFDPTTGKYHVGRSGLDLKGGAEWMSPAEMEARMGKVQGGLLADAPLVPAPSVADQDDNPVAWLGRAKEAIGASLSGAAQATTGAARGAADAMTGAVGRTASSLGGMVSDFATNLGEASLTRADMERRARQEIGGAIGAAASDVLTTTGETTLRNAAVQRAGIQATQDAVGPMLKGPSLLSDEEVLQRSTPSQIESATEQARLWRELITREGGAPSQKEVVDVLRAQMLGTAAAGTHGAPGGKLPAGKLPGEVPPGGKRMSDQEVGTLLDTLESAYDDLQAQLDMVLGQAGATSNPGRAKMLENQADRLQGEMTRMLETARYVDEHRMMPPDEAVTTAPALPDEPVESAASRMARLTPEDLRRAIDDTGTTPLQTEFLYSVLPEYRGGPIAPTSRGVRGDDPRPVTWLTEGAPLGSRSGTMVAIEKRMLDASLLDRAPNGYPVYRGEIPPAAVTNLGQAGPDLTVPLLERFRRSVAGDPVAVTPPPSGPRIGIDDESLRQQGHVFRETTAARQAAQLPGPGPRGGGAREIPAGARPIDLTTSEEVARLRLEQWPEEIRDTIRQAAEARDFGRVQRRGRIGDPASETMADTMDRTFDEWVKGAKAGKAYNAEELRALRNAVGAQAARVNQLTADVTVARTAGNLTDNLLIRQFSEGQKLQALSEILEGGKAEWGRSGRAFQGAVRLVDLPPDEATARIYQMVGSRENALKALEEYQKLLDSNPNDIIAQARFWAGVKNPPVGVEDWFRLLRYNSMLSGPRTFEVNVIGNALEVPWRLARDVGASVVRGNPREVAPELAGIAAGFAKGRQKFLEVWSDGITQEMALAGDLPRDVSARLSNPKSVRFGLSVPAAQRAAGALEVPGRIMRGADEWAYAIAREMALGRRAAVSATREGLKGKAWDARVAELMATPTSGMTKEADAIAERMTYRGDMGTLGQKLAGIQQVPYLGPVVLPFLRTVYHITARGVDRSPLGLFGTARDVARGAYGPRNLRSLGRALTGETVTDLPKGVAPLGERLTDNLVGTAAVAGFYQFALQGNISGSGPVDAQKRDMLRAQGWQPYSVKIGDRWVSYSNWGPVAIPLSAAAAAAEAQTYRKPGVDALGILADAMFRTTELATEQSYLQGIGVVWKGLSEPDRFGARFVGQLVQSLVPFGSALNTLGQATDTVQRAPNRENLGEFIGQSVAARLPGTRQLVPEAQDQLGRPIPNEQAGFNALNPLRASGIRSSAVLNEMLANGADVGDPPKTFRSVPLKPDEQREYNAAAGRYVEEAVASLMRDPTYRSFTPAEKQRSLQRAVEAARSRAGGELMQRMGTSEASRRVREEREKMVPVPIR